MDKYTPERLRQDFVGPLSELVALLNAEAERLKKAHETGQISRNYLPINEAGALGAIKKLNSFLRKEVRTKLDEAIDGTLRYREEELKKAKLARKGAPPKRKNTD